MFQRTQSPWHRQISYIVKNKKISDLNHEGGALNDFITLCVVKIISYVNIFFQVIINYYICCHESKKYCNTL